MLKMKLFACLCLISTVGHAADQEQVPVGSIENPTELAQSIPVLAKRVVAVYQESDRRQYLDNQIGRAHV